MDAQRLDGPMDDLGEKVEFPVDGRRGILLLKTIGNVALDVLRHHIGKRLEEPFQAQTRLATRWKLADTGLRIGTQWARALGLGVGVVEKPPSVYRSTSHPLWCGHFSSM